MESRVVSMTMLVLSHGHLMRLTVRRRAGTDGRDRTQYRVYHVKRACQECRSLSPRLVRSSREFRVRIVELLMDGHSVQRPACRRSARR
jgi:hypothetical protein